MAKTAAEGKADTKTCPQCGENAVIIASFPDRKTYKCPRCRSENTYMDSPVDIQRKKEKKNETKLSTMTLRDKSKKEKEPKKEQPKEPEQEKKPTPLLAAIKESMEKKKLLQFEYIGNDGIKKNRLVEPYKLAFDKTGNVILYAYCTEGNGIRMFKIRGILNAVMQEYNYEPRWPIEDTTEPSTDSTNSPNK